MKKYIIAMAAVAFMASCGSENNAESANTEETTTDATATTEATEVADPNTKIDPVCEMAKDDTWTEYSVSGTDTVWFCSSTCKEAYDANPAKYAKK
jgi:YHS domain-containing protein